MKVLVCDCHEPQSIQRELQTQFPQMQVAELGLSSGDLFAQLSNGIAIFERKTPEDFVASIADGRLFEQSQTIPTLARFPVLVLDGEFQWSRDGRMMVVHPNTGYGESNWKRASVEMAKLRAQANGMLFAECGGESYAATVARLLVWCETKADDGYGYHKKRVTLIPFEDEHEQRAVDMLTRFPGIGYDKALPMIQPLKEFRLIEILLWFLNKAKSNRAARRWLEMEPNESLKLETDHVTGN